MVINFVSDAGEITAIGFCEKRIVPVSASINTAARAEIAGGGAAGKSGSEKSAAAKQGIVTKQKMKNSKTRLDFRPLNFNLFSIITAC
jgi:hypothetical protein